MIKNTCIAELIIKIKKGDGDFMEFNQIHNANLKERISSLAVKLLLDNKIITEEERAHIKATYGYVFTKADGMVEALLYLTTENQNKYYFAVQKEKLLRININEDLFNQTVMNMRNLHECLKSNEIEETSIQKGRRQVNNDILIQKNISLNPNLACLYKDEQVKIKSLDEICRRAIASLIVIQVACDINAGKYEESKEFFIPLLKRYDVSECLNSKEKRIMDGTYSKQDVVDIDWAYEAYWALVWFLGLTDEMADASKLCDCSKAMDFVISSKAFEDFKSKCNPRSVKELLDMEDLYYRYNWAINEKRVNPNANIGNINPSNVIERRRALEWLLSNKEDWYEISLNA